MDKLRESFTAELKALEKDVLKMGEVVSEMLQKAMEAFKSGKVELADRVIAMDDIVDKYNMDIETKSLQLIALQQPVGRDLRIIATAMRVITDIERMGDYTIDITKFAKRLMGQPKLPQADAIPQIAEVVGKMLKETLQAFVNKDLKLVQQMIEHDDVVDKAFIKLFDELVAEIEKNPTSARPAIQLLMIARYLERIADHITNVGERVFYVETGEIKELH